MIPRIDVHQLADRLAKGEPTLLLDVPQTWEHETVALPASCLIPLDQLAQRVDEVEPPDDAMIVVYCHHGIRSQSGVAMLKHMGFRNVVSLDGGIDAWSLLVDPKLPRY